MSKPKYYLKPVWMLKDQLKGDRINGIGKTTWERLRKENLRPGVSDKFPVIGTKWLIPCWGLTKRLSMELRRTINNRDIITLPL